MNQTDLGANVRAAVEAVRDLYEQVDSLFGDLDKLFERAGLRPGRAGNKGIEKRNLGVNKTANLGEGRFWMPLHFYSTYVPKGSAKTDSVLLIEALLDPDYDEPTLLAVGAQLRKPFRCDSIWDDWTVERAVWNQVRGIARFGESVSLPFKTAVACYHRASTAHLYAVKLCDLDSANLGSRFATPAASLLSRKTATASATKMAARV